jgi:hypothetical protein
MHWPQFDLHGILLDIREDLGAVKARLEANTERLDRIEDRVDRSGPKLSDLVPFIPGVIVLTLWLTGRIDTAALVALLSGR